MKGELFVLFVSDEIVRIEAGVCKIIHPKHLANKCVFLVSLEFFDVNFKIRELFYIYLLSISGDLTKWLRGSNKTMEGSASTGSSNHVFPTSQQSCLEASSLIKLPSNQLRAGAQQHQQQQQQLVFLTSNGTASVLPAAIPGTFGNVVVQQTASDSSRTLWTPTPQTQ